MHALSKSCQKSQKRSNKAIFLFFVNIGILVGLLRFVLDFRYSFADMFFGCIVKLEYTFSWRILRPKRKLMQSSLLKLCK